VQCGICTCHHAAAARLHQRGTLALIALLLLLLLLALVAVIILLLLGVLPLTVALALLLITGGAWRAQRSDVSAGVARCGWDRPPLVSAAALVGARLE
jgi:Flp pilus assembly protein TadB